MTPTEGQRRLRRLLGQRACWRVDDRAAKPHDREAALAALPIARQRWQELTAARDARYRAILAGDAEYQRLFAEAKAAREAADRLGHIAHNSHRITVGIDSGLFFDVKAHGDNWQEVIDILEARERDNDAPRG